MVSGSGSGGRSAFGAFAILVVPLGIGAVLAVWALAISPLQSASEVRPVVAEVQIAERANGLSTTATLVPATEVGVKSQSSGTVTALSLGVGVPIDQGDVAFETDGLPVVAYVADAPLYRDITADLRGADVSTAQHLLVDLGYLNAADGIVGATTRAAIRAFNADHGRGTNTTTLTVGSLVWIPSGSDAPNSVAVRVGDVLAPQTPLYSTTAGSASVSAGTTAGDKDRTLTIGTVTVALPAGQDSVTDPGDVALLRDTLGDQASAPATVADLVPPQVGTVPATAVVVDAEGHSCYFTAVDGDPVAVDATQGGLGLVDVGPELVGTPVLVNPRSTRDDLSCAS